MTLRRELRKLKKVVETQVRNDGENLVSSLGAGKFDRHVFLCSITSLIFLVKPGIMVDYIYNLRSISTAGNCLFISGLQATDQAELMYGNC